MCSGDIHDPIVVDTLQSSARDQRATQFYTSQNVKVQDDLDVQ